MQVMYNAHIFFILITPIITATYACILTDKNLFDIIMLYDRFYH